MIMITIMMFIMSSGYTRIPAKVVSVLAADVACKRLVSENQNSRGRFKVSGVS